MTTRQLSGGAADQAVQLAHYSTDIAAAALQLACTRCPDNDPTDELAIAEVLIRTATAIQALAHILIDHHHTPPCGELP
jgi:hypothetical protein